VRFGKRQRTTQFFAVLNMLRMAKKGVDGRRRRDGVTRSLPCATHKYSRHRKKKKRKKSKAGRARLCQATTMPSPAAGPPFPTLATPPPPHHHGSSQRRPLPWPTASAPHQIHHRVVPLLHYYHR
jgi:hypothetical protein